MPRKSYSTAPKKGKVKPRLEWRVVEATPSDLIQTLQELTDEKWRIFAINTLTPERLLVSAYLSAWGEKDTAAEDASDS